MKICPVGAELSNGRADGETDSTKLIVTLRNFANTPNTHPQIARNTATQTVFPVVPLTE